MNNTDPNKERLWKQIESQIKTDGLYRECNREVLIRAIEDLPASSPKKDLWSTIEKEIRQFTPNSRKQDNYRYTIGIAATIILLIATFFIYHHVDKKETSKVLYAVQEEPIDIFLSRICTVNPRKCFEPGFIELRSEIVELTNEKSEVKNSIFSNPSDEDMVKANERIEKQIKNLKNQLIKYVE